MVKEEKKDETSLSKKVVKKLRAKKNTIISKRIVRNYPTVSIEKCLVIAQKIKILNGGNPWNSKEISQAIGMANNFYYYSTASRDFGFTPGTRYSLEIALANLGREIVHATTPVVERTKKKETFLSINLFTSVLDYYKGALYRRG